MINTVAQGVLGRDRSLSVGQVLRSARVWAWQRNFKSSLLFSRSETAEFDPKAMFSQLLTTFTSTCSPLTIAHQQATTSMFGKHMWPVVGSEHTVMRFYENHLTSSPYKIKYLRKFTFEIGRCQRKNFSDVIIW